LKDYIRNEEEEVDIGEAVLRCHKNIVKYLKQNKLGKIKTYLEKIM